MTEEELREIERQLSCPTGENGIYVANNMNESNISMTLASIDAMQLEAGDHLLEIGHGNCGHLTFVHEQAENLQYTGLEISETMQIEAKRINAHYPAEFLLYDGLKLPFKANSFDKIFTVNTVYFWENAVAFIQEIERVLKKNGTFVLTFALKQFMRELPFVDSKFALFDEEDIRPLIAHTKLRIKDTTKVFDTVISKALDEVKREFLVVTLKK